MDPGPSAALQQPTCTCAPQLTRCGCCQCRVLVAAGCSGCARAVLPQASTYLLRTYRVPAGTAAALLSSSSLSLPASNATAGELLFIGSTSIGSPARGSMVELWRFRSAADALAASQLAAAGSSGVGAAAQAAEAQQGGVAAWARALARAAPEAADSVQQAEVVVLRPAAWSNWQ